MKGEWIECKTGLPPNDVVVETKIDDAQGCRNQGAKLRRYKSLWFTPDKATYVYYTPTHWRPI